ncbi:transporter [Pseudoscourfieldia marina]
MSTSSPPPPLATLPSRRAMAVRSVVLASLGGLLFGYDLGFVGGALDSMGSDLELTTVGKEGVVASAKFGAAFGSLLGGATLVALGRRTSIALSALPYTVGPAIMLVAPNVYVMVVGRWVTGLGVGISSVASPCYLCETATPEARGTLVACYEVAIAVGFLVATATDYAFSNVSHGWRYLVCIGLPPAVALPLAMVALPESPRWLIMRGEMRRALRAIEWLRGASPPPGWDAHTPRRPTATQIPAVDGVDVSHCTWVNDELLEIWDSVERFERMQQLSSDSRASDPAAPAPPRHLPFSSSAWYSTCGALLSNARAVARLLRTGAGPERRGLLIACTLAFFNQMCASTSIIVYVQELAHLAGVTSSASRNLIASAVAASKLVGVMFGLWAVDRLGRRPLLLFGSSVGAAALLVLAVGSSLGNVALLVTFACAFTFTFYSSWGTVYWVLSSELFTTETRGAGQGLATALLYIFGSTSSMMFLSVAKSAMGLYPFAFVMLMSLVFVFLCVPETRGLTLEEVMEKLAVGGGGATKWTDNELAAVSEDGQPTSEGDSSRLVAAGATSSTSAVYSKT